MRDTDLTDLFATTETGPEPALPVDYVERTLTRARRSVNRRRGAGIAVLILMVVSLLMVAPWLGRQRELMPAGPPDRPSLPTEFADFSRFTSRAEDQPAGRAIALYEYGSSELFTSWQTLVIGADRDTYRRLNTDDDVAPAVLLAPDGRSVMYFHESKGTDEFTLLDLTTGATSVRHSVEWYSNVGAGVTMLDWSPDGRYLAYAVPAPPNGDGTADSSFELGEFRRNVAILDVARDTTVLVPWNGPIAAATFSPDSQRLALQSSRESAVFSSSGERIGTWRQPAGISPWGGLAWSPDGRWMATVLAPLPRSDGSTSSADSRIRFVDMAGTGVPVPAELPYGEVLGWRSPTSIVVMDWPEDDQAYAFVEVSIVDGSRTVLSRFPTARSCEYGLHTCAPYRAQLATNLIGEAGTRPANPDRGPWVTIVHTGLIVLAVLMVATLTAALVRSHRRWLRRNLR